MRLRRRQPEPDPQPQPDVDTEVAAARKHNQDANADLFERNRERYEPTGPASPEELTEFEEANQPERRPQPKYLTLPPDLQMSPRERKLAIYEELERRIEVKRERLKHAASGARRAAEKNLERMEEQHDRLHQELFPPVSDDDLAEHAQTFKPCRVRDCPEVVDSKDAYAQSSMCARHFWLASNADRLPPREDTEPSHPDPF